MLLFREKIPADWLPKMLANLPAVLDRPCSPGAKGRHDGA